MKGGDNMTFTTSEYTGGVHGWGDMISKCTSCGEIVSRYECDENGIPVKAVFDHTESHECDYGDDE